MLHLRYWIEEGRLAGGSCPNAEDLPGLEEEFDAVISLVEDDRQYMYSPEDVRDGVRWINVPMTDHTTPSLGQLAEFYETFWGLPGTAKVFVHCLGGIGRTGTVAASYLMWRGRSLEAAFEQVDKWTQGFFSVEIRPRLDEVKYLMMRFKALFQGEAPSSV